MNDSTKLLVCMRLKEASLRINDLFESLASGSPDLTLLADANALHDGSAELLALILDAAKPPGALAFSGDFVELGADIAPGSAQDQANQRLSDGFRAIGGDIAAELERAS